MQQDGRPFPEKTQYGHFLAQKAVEKLEHAVAGATKDKPIYLQLDIFDPRQPVSVRA